MKNTCRTVCKYLSFSQDFKFILQSRNVTRLFQMEDLTWSAAVTWEPRASTTVPKVTSQQWRIKSYTVVTMETGVFKWKNSVSTSLVLIGKVKQCNYSCQVLILDFFSPLFKANLGVFFDKDMFHFACTSRILPKKGEFE